MEIARVMFNSGPVLYDYFTDIPLAVGDFVVVPAGDRFSVARVHVIKHMEANTVTAATKFVVQRVDIKDYAKRLHARGRTVKEMLTA